MAIPTSFLDALRDLVPISDVVGPRVPLKRAGRELKACCPFHAENTPSFYVSDEKGFAHCFGCGVHTDIFGFLIRHDHLEFPEAVEVVARMAGLPMPEVDERYRDHWRRVKATTDLLRDTTAWFEERLWAPEGAEALAYLRGRGLSDDVIRKWRLGYAPADRQALRNALRAKGYGDDLGVQAGVLMDKSNGVFCPLANRVLFPIATKGGSVVAFGGRLLGAGTDHPDAPKYWNTPETVAFRKSTTLFGLSRANVHVRPGTPPVVVEGYMDVIALHAAGIETAVAPLGTALTDQHVEMLWRLHQMPVICFDGDRAGREAARRLCERVLPLIHGGQSIRIAFLPAGLDPDDLVRQRGAEAMRRVIEDAMPLVDAIWHLETDGQPNTPEAIASLKNTLYAAASQVKMDATLRDAFFATFRGRLDRLRGSGRGGAQVMSLRRAKADADLEAERLPILLVMAAVRNHPEIVQAHHFAAAAGLSALPAAVQSIDVDGDLTALSTVVLEALHHADGFQAALAEAVTLEGRFGVDLRRPLRLLDSADLRAYGEWVAPGTDAAEVWESLAPLLDWLAETYGQEDVGEALKRRVEALIALLVGQPDRVVGRMTESVFEALLGLAVALERTSDMPGAEQAVKAAIVVLVGVGQETVGTDSASVMRSVAESLDDDDTGALVLIERLLAHRSRASDDEIDAVLADVPRLLEAFTEEEVPAAA
ncbi:DNA primase [Azospirillum thiophilum]|uniref:DNA primase n=1 Tax=Azospirillum thiophilum TaxID=528244 RepID=UPI00069671DD|nr:DNA primase [Azospirillum thiophilum]